MPSTEKDVIDNAMESGEPGVAEAAFREIESRLRILKHSKERADLILRRAVLYGVLGRFHDARAEISVALSEAPDDPDVQLQADVIDGSLYDQEGKPAEAYARLTTALSKHRARLCTSDLAFLYEDVQQRRAFDLVRINNFQEAVPLLREILSFRLSSEIKSAALANLGFCYAKLSEYEQARDCFMQVIEIGVTKAWEGKVHFYLGLACAQLHLLREAKHEFQLCEHHAAEYNVAIANVYGWLSWVCKGLGERTESERYARLARQA
jgi:tetratricopeptide (TPR) repeat protein